MIHEINKNVKINGNTIEYKDLGKGNPIVFIHGAFSSGNTWRKVIPALSRSFRCIAPDWPFGGHKSPLLNNFDFTPIGIADLITKFIDTLKLQNVIIIANDTGGAYAQVFTSRYKEKVSALILSNCEGFEIFPPKKFQSLKSMVKVPGYLWLLSKIFSYKPALKWNITFGLLSHKLEKEELFSFYVKYFVKNKLIRNDFKKLAMEWDPKYTEQSAQALTNFKKPVLILWGKDDRELFPIELGKRVNSIFQHSTFVEIPNSLTYVQEDNPEIVIEQIIKFTQENALQ